MKHILTLEQFLIRESLQTFYRGSTSNTRNNNFVWLTTSQKHAEHYADVNSYQYGGDKKIDTFRLDLSILNILDLTMYDTDENLDESECSDFLSDINIDYDIDIDLFNYDDTIPLSVLLNRNLHILMRNIDGFKIMESGIETICIKKDFLNTVNESKAKSKRKLSYGCVMLYFDFPDMSDIQDKIEKEDIYDEKGYGLENKPHITLLYGLHDDEIEDEDRIFDKLFDILDAYKYPKKEDSIILTLHNVSLFENEYDVLKFDVKDDSGNNILKKCNKTLCDNFPFTTDYPDYHAHSTLAYLKKGCGKKYVKMFKDLEFKIVAKKIVYSKADNTKKSKNI